MNIFSGISLLVVINLSFVTKKFPSGEESLLVLWDVLSVLCYEKLFRIVLLFVYGLTFISYFCCVILLLLFVNGSFFLLCSNTPAHSILCTFIRYCSKVLYLLYLKSPF